MDSLEADIFREFLADPEAIQDLNIQLDAIPLSTSPSATTISTSPSLAESVPLHGPEDSDSDDGATPPSSPSLAAVRLETLASARSQSPSQSPIASPAVHPSLSSSSALPNEADTTASAAPHSDLPASLLRPDAMPLPPAPRQVPLLPEAYSSVEFLSRLSLAHSQWSGKPSVPPHLAASLLFPPAALAHITAALLGVSAYCHAAVFDKLLLFQHLWCLDADNKASTTPAVIRVAANAVAASQGLALTAPPPDEAEPFVLGATIHRLYTTLLSALDREARLFFMLLPVPPPSAPDLRPIPPEALRQWFLVDLPGCAPCMQHVRDTRQHKPRHLKQPQGPEGQAQPESEPEDADEAAVAGGGLNGDELLPMSRRSIRLNSGAPVDADHCDYTTVSHFDAAGQRVFPTPIAFDPAWLTHTFLEPASWAPLLLSVVDLHPGLEFLSSAGDFQQRYAQTVIARLYYTTNPRGDDRMLLRHLRNSDLIQRLDVLWGNEDVNRAHDYFSYEHFYVLYCKFWELDADHDMLLQPSDLLQYEEGALSNLVLQRVSDPYSTLQQSAVLAGEAAPVLTYEQFVSFCVAEVDKSSRRAIRYWLRRVDLDNDGMVGPDDIFQLLSEQVRRVRDAAGESVNIRDLSCQLWDMLGIQRPQPITCTICAAGHADPADAAEHDHAASGKVPSSDPDAAAAPGSPLALPATGRLAQVPQSGRFSGVLSYSTLRKSGLAATIFDLLFNLNKFVQSEARDVNRIRAQQAGHDEWERWAAQTYYMLAGAEVDAHREQ